MSTQRSLGGTSQVVGTGMPAKPFAGAPASLLDRYVDPATSMGEILFGLIMTLTFTLGAGLIIEDEGRAGARELLIAVLGCNIAWGIIDGALYLAGQLFDRGRWRRLGTAIRASSDERSATQIVSMELGPLLSDVLTPAESDALYGRVVKNVRGSPERPTRITKDDWIGAFTSCWLVAVASIPAALPFLFIDDARLALRVSNAVLLLLLFVTGYWWARYTLGRPWLVGTVFLVIGLALVAAAIALGG